MSEHLTEADAPFQKPVPLVQELRIEACLVPNRRAELYRLAAARIDELEAKLRDEEERHAALQSRCFEGFPSATDGIFDALKQADEVAGAAAVMRQELDAKLFQQDEVLKQITVVAESARLTRSRDVDDWAEDMEYIEAMAKGLRPPPERHAEGAEK